jgi:hypothetical protein
MLHSSVLIISILLYHFPTVVNMPWWIPGAGFKKEAQLEWVPHVRAALHAPYEAVKRQMARKPSSQ